LKNNVECSSTIKIKLNLYTFYYIIIYYIPILMTDPSDPSDPTDPTDPTRYPTTYPTTHPTYDPDRDAFIHMFRRAEDRADLDGSLRAESDQHRRETPQERAARLVEYAGQHGDVPPTPPRRLAAAAAVAAMPVRRWGRIIAPREQPSGPSELRLLLDRYEQELMQQQQQEQQQEQQQQQEQRPYNDFENFDGGKYNKKDMKNFMKMLKNKNKKSTKQVVKNRNTKKNKN